MPPMPMLGRSLLKDGLVAAVPRRNCSVQKVELKEPQHEDDGAMNDTMIGVELGV